jgi:hypothetical protein
MLRVDTTTMTVASFGLAVSLFGILISQRNWRRLYVTYAFFSLVILFFYFFAALLCGIEPNSLPLTDRRAAKSLAFLSSFVCITLSVQTFVAAYLAGRVFTAQRLGAACAFISLVSSCCLVAFGSQLEPETHPASAYVIAAGSVEIADSLFAIPMFLFRWKKSLALHAGWSAMSALMLFSGAIVSLTTEKDIIFSHCHKLLDDCTSKQLTLLAGLAAMTCIVSVADLVCSGLLLMNKRKVATEERHL